MLRNTVLLSCLYTLAYPKLMEGSEGADFGYEPCYQWDTDSETWVTESLVSAVAAEAERKSDFKYTVTLTMQYDSSSFYYFGYCDQNLWFNFAVEWTLGGSEVDENYNFFYNEGVYDEDTKECVLEYANEGSTPVTNGEEYILRNEKKKTGACGINLYLDYEDSGSNLASTTTVIIHTNQAMRMAMDSFVLIGMTFLF